MAVFRVEKNANYTVMSNFHFKEKEMSLKAKGLLSLMLSLPDTWDYSIGGLVSVCKEGEKSIKTALQELRKFGYLKMNRRHFNGRYDWEYVIYECPETVTTVPLQDNCNGNTITPLQGGCNEPVENVSVENGVIYKDTKESNTNESNTKVNVKKERRKSFDDLIDSYTSNPELQEELKNHLATRKAKKATLTNRAIELSLKKLDELTSKIPVNMQEEAKIKIVQQSIERGWVGFFEIKEQQNFSNKKSSGWDYVNEEYKKIQEKNDIF